MLNIFISVPDANNGSFGGELMAYNPPPNLMDFDDILLENAASPVSSDLPTNNLYTSYCTDPLDLEEAEDSFFDSLVPGDVNTSI